MDFLAALKKFDDALRRLPEKSLLAKSPPITDYEEKKNSFLFSSYQAALNSLLAAPVEGETKERIGQLRMQLKSAHRDKATEIIAELYALSSRVQEKPSMSFKIPNIPSDIAQEMEADISELSRCFSQNCYRASIILCGRILETALHRKYFEATGLDIL